MVIPASVIMMALYDGVTHCATEPIIAVISYGIPVVLFSLASRATLISNDCH